MVFRRGNNSNQNDFVISFADCPAKTFINSGGETVPGRSVLEHCLIVGAIAREIVDRFPSDMGAKLFPPEVQLVAAAHDIGKVSPYFYEKIRRHFPPGTWDLPGNPNLDLGLEKSWGGHAGVSLIAAQALGVPHLIPEILGQHHGYFPMVGCRSADSEVFGGAQWQQERSKLTLELQKKIGCDWPLIVSSEQARIVAGLTSVADWIGSGEFFEDPTIPWQESIKSALDSAGFIQPIFQSGLSFKEIFEFNPYEIQKKLIAQVSSPGVYFLEAPMGIGKTEAALFAAYQLASKGKARGIYFALPTQLTSNKIHERFSKFLQRILVPESDHQPLLLHSNAGLLQTAEYGEEGRPGGAWFNSAKRGLLAPFAVGTIDQALMAAMNVKHGFVRAFGLAGKVVILDEVHTYDTFTGTLLDETVALLRKLHCTVIILSATLNTDRREQILGEKVSSIAYPLITAKPNKGNLVEAASPIKNTQSVEIHMVDQTEKAIEESLKRAAQGQQVLWIENTVDEAQQRFLDIAARAYDLGVACGLIHSRFTAEDRQIAESQWVGHFGKPGWDTRKDMGRILVGTQVLEQSLDIDSDFLVSRFAPTDMLLQRMGRLWRHKDTPRCSGSKCEAWVLVENPDESEVNPLQAFGKTSYVYSPYVLCRSLEVWREKESIILPADIRDLIEETYKPRPESKEMEKWLDELENGKRGRLGRRGLRQLAMVSMAELGKTLPESRAQTRHSESQHYDVLLLGSVVPLQQKKATRITLISGDVHDLPLQRHCLDKQGWRNLSIILMRQVVSVRAQDAPVSLPHDTLRKMGLHHCFYLGNPALDESVLRVALVDRTGALKGVQRQQVHEKYELRYQNDLGYLVVKTQGAGYGK